METSVSPPLYAVDLRECRALHGLAPDDVAAAFGSALCHAGATIVHGLSHAFPGAGMTCVFILTESHAVMHTWPETGTVNIDIFSCSTKLESLKAVDALCQSFGATRVIVREIPRADGHGR